MADYNGLMDTPIEYIVNRIDATGDCWEWTLKPDKKGYGVARNQRAHRFVWEALVGEIPEGLETDHLCKNTICVKPDHMEMVTHAENVRRSSNRNGRKTHCPQGHEYSFDNTYLYSGRRYCRTCSAAYKKSADARRVQVDGIRRVRVPK